MRARVYIDGFNLYYGALKGSPHKWLNPFALASLLLPKNRIEAVRRKFNNAVILMCPHDKPSAQLRQLTTMQKRISKWALEQAQFPGQLTDADGTFTKPRGW